MVSVDVFELLCVPGPFLMASLNAVHLSGCVCCSWYVCDILVYPRMCLSLPAHCRNNVHVAGSCGCSCAHGGVGREREAFSAEPSVISGLQT